MSSVDSQLTNPAQIVNDPHGDKSAGGAILPSPAEDGSYGTNGLGVFGFTPEDVYIETNLKYLVSTIPLNFPGATRIAIVSSNEAMERLERAKAVMAK